MDIVDYFINDHQFFIEFEIRHSTVNGTSLKASCEVVTVADFVNFLHNSRFIAADFLNVAICFNSF